MMSLAVVFIPKLSKAELLSATSSRNCVTKSRHDGRLDDLRHLGKGLRFPERVSLYAMTLASNSAEYDATTKAGCLGTDLSDLTCACPTPTMSFSSR